MTETRVTYDTTVFGFETNLPERERKPTDLERLERDFLTASSKYLDLALGFYDVGDRNGVEHCIARADRMRELAERAGQGGAEE